MEEVREYITIDELATLTGLSTNKLKGLERRGLIESDIVKDKYKRFYSLKDAARSLRAFWLYKQLNNKVRWRGISAIKPSMFDDYLNHFVKSVPSDWQKYVDGQGWQFLMEERAGGFSGTAFVHFNRDSLLALKLNVVPDFRTKFWHSNEPGANWQLTSTVSWDNTLKRSYPIVGPAKKILAYDPPRPPIRPSSPDIQPPPPDTKDEEEKSK